MVYCGTNSTNSTFKRFNMLNRYEEPSNQLEKGLNVRGGVKMIKVSSVGHQAFWLSNIMLPVLDTENCFNEYLLLHINQTVCNVVNSVR